MNKLFGRLLLLSLILSISSAWAAKSENPGLSDAIQICEGLYGTDHQFKCIKAVQKSSYLDPEAVKICAGLYGTDQKLKCLDQISDQEYNARLVKLCSEKYGTDKKIECLKISGKPHANSQPTASSAAETPASSKTLKDIELELEQALLFAKNDKKKKLMKSLRALLKQIRKLQRHSDGPSQ